MQAQGTSPKRLVYYSILRLLVIGTFADLGLLVTFLGIHAASGSEALLKPVEALAAALGLLASSSVILGVVYGWSAYPKHRRPILFLVVITLGTLMAHAYVIGSPPAGTPGDLSGAVGSELHDGKITVQSSFVNQSLSVMVHASGGSAIGELQLSTPGATLLSGGFNPQPSFASPMAANAATGGTWRVQGNVSQIDISYQFLNCYDTGGGHYGCVMDESFYVPEAMGLLAGQPCSDGFADGYHCHMEHPYLAPALVAAGMAVFGEFSSASWRAFPVLLGTFSIPLTFGIAWKLTTERRLAYLAALFLALDVMFFSQSGAALLDIPGIFFGLCAMFAYLWDLRLWKLDKYVITGTLLGLAGLAKETGIFVALGLLTYIFFFDQAGRWQRFRNTMKVVVVLALVFTVGLQAYDSTLVSPNGLAAGIQNSCPGQTAISSYPNFVDHMRYMLCYGSSLIAHTWLCQGAPSGSGYWCKYPNAPIGFVPAMPTDWFIYPNTPPKYIPILPIDWLTYYSPVAYYSTSVTVCTQGGNPPVNSCYSYVQLAYYGVTNFVVTWLVFVWVPLLAYALYRGLRRPAQGLEAFGFVHPQERAPASSEVKFAAFTLSWFAWNYLSYLGLLALGRVSYPFYIVPAIPALALGAAYFVTRKWFPKWLLLVYVAVVFSFFFIYFPSKAFLPEFLRALIGH